MKQLSTLLQQFCLLLVIVHCTIGVTSTTTTQSPPKATSLPNVEAKNFLPFKAGSWPSVDPKNSDPFYLRHLSRSHEKFFTLRTSLLLKLHPDAPFRLTFRYWANHDLARIRVYLANGGRQDYLLNRENQWTDAEINIEPAKSGRWTHLELLGGDDSYTFALKNATVHYTDKAKEERHTLVCEKDDFYCYEIFENGFSLISQQYVKVNSSSTPANDNNFKYIPVFDSVANEDSFVLNLTMTEYDRFETDYCLYFNFSTQEGNPLKVTAERLDVSGRNFSLTYCSYDGPLVKVCTSWLKPDALVRQLLITFEHPPDGLLDTFWVQLVKAELIKPKIYFGHALYGTEEVKKIGINYNWADLFVNVPPTVDLSKQGQIGFKLDQLHALKLDHRTHIVELSTIWFNSVKTTATKDNLVALRLTPSGDYKANYLDAQVIVSSPSWRTLEDDYISKKYPRENASQLVLFNCSHRFQVCEEADYNKVTFRFHINLEEAVDLSVQQININYSNVSINNPCVDPATGADEKCNGHGICFSYLPDFSATCLCDDGFAGKHCEHVRPTAPVQQTTSKAINVKSV